MADISGEDRSQVLLLPDAVEDYVGPDNPVRFIDAFSSPLRCTIPLQFSGLSRLAIPRGKPCPITGPPRARRCIRKPHRQSHQSGIGWI